MRLSSYLLSAQQVLLEYKGDIPFAAWLKNYFKLNKKFGSCDRRLVADLCFCFFRLGRAFADLSVGERLLIAQFLCHQESAFILEERPEWNAQAHLPVDAKLALLRAAGPAAFFPFTEEVSDEIDRLEFATSHLRQPDFFLRLRPGKQDLVVKKLKEAGIEFLQQEQCIRLFNRTKVDDIIGLDDEAVVQDLSSQQVLNPLKENLGANAFTSWDCCAASGGKSILLHDLFPKARLTVSDIRESILNNLKNRLKRARISSYQSFVADVSSASFLLPKTFDVIICDAPCSGSGTWGRTPEQLQFFLGEKISGYANLQKSIAANAVRCLARGGYFVYITCSVFKKENEDVVSYLQQNTGLKLLSARYIQGYQQKADTLYTALFTTS